MGAMDADTIRHTIERYAATGELPRELYAEDLVFVTRGELAGHTEYHGHEGYRRGLAELRETWPELRPRVTDVTYTGEDSFLMALHFNLRSRSGVALEVDEHWAVWVRDGKYSRFEQYGTREEALAALGSSGAVEVVRSMYDAFHGGDFERALSHFAEDVVIDATNGRVDADVQHGPQGVATTIGSWTAAFDEWRDEIDELRELGDRVYAAATQYGRGKDTGIEVETRYGIVYEVRDGKITRMTLYSERDDALRAAGAG